MVNSLKFIVKQVFLWFRRLHFQTVRVPTFQNETKLHPQFDEQTATNTMFEKGIPNRWKIILNMIKKGSEK